jgi:hypothetical protein
MLRKNRWATFVILALALTVNRTGRTQSTTGTITGTVTDQANAVVTEAEVILRNTQTGLVKHAATNRSGQYVLDFIPVGHYTLEVTGTGFGAKRRDDIDISADQGLQINFVLPVATANQSVTVTSEAPLVSVGTSDQRGEVTSTQLNELPVAHQDWTTLLQTTPGVAQTNNGSAGSEEGSGIVINGLPATGYNLTVDGTNATQDVEHPAFGFSGEPNIINTINNDAIQEISMVRGIAPASVSGTMAGNINIITKGGTNGFHGDAYEINEENLYDARNQFLTDRPRTTFNQFGAALSGPFFKNRLFFFSSFEGVRLDALAGVGDNVPTPYLIGISPAVYQSILATFPTVAQPAGDPTAETVYLNKTGSSTQDDENFAARIDYNPSEHNQIMARYVRARPRYTNPNIIAINSRVYDDHSDMYNATWIHSGTSWVSNTRFGLDRLAYNRVDEAYSQGYEGVSYGGFGTGGTELVEQPGKVLTFEDSISWTRQRHTFQAGAIVQRLNDGRTDLNNTNFKYSSLSDYLANIPSSVEVTFPLEPFNIVQYQYGGYIQDDFRVRSNLTINAGIRYDHYQVPQEDSGRFFNRGVNPQYPQLGPGFGPYVPADQLYFADYKDIQPRVGFSLGLGARGSTVVRGGFGVYVNPHEIYGAAINEVQTNSFTPFRITLNRAQALQAGIKFPLAQSDYTTLLQQLIATGVATSSFANSAVNQHYPDPLSLQYTLAIDQAMPGDMALTIGYVGNWGTKENITEVADLPDRITGISPYPTFSQFNYYFAGDRSNYNALQVELKKRLRHGLFFDANYTWGRNMAIESAGLLKEQAPQDNNNLDADYGPSPYDIRNNFVLNGIWNLPISDWTGIHNGVMKSLVDGWQFSGLFLAQSGSPNNIEDGNSSYPSDRPDPVPTVNPYIGHFSIGQLQYLNPGAYSNPALSVASGAQVRPGFLSRNSVYNPRIINLNASIAKSFRFADRVDFKLHMDAFNALNHTILGGLDTSTTDGNFGQLTSATARTVQIGGKVSF